MHGEQSKHIFDASPMCNKSSRLLNYYNPIYFAFKFNVFVIRIKSSLHLILCIADLVMLFFISHHHAIPVCANNNYTRKKIIRNCIKWIQSQSTTMKMRKSIRDLSTQNAIFEEKKKKTESENKIRLNLMQNTDSGQASSAVRWLHRIILKASTMIFQFIHILHLNVQHTSQAFWILLFFSCSNYTLHKSKMSFFYFHLIYRLSSELSTVTFNLMVQLFGDEFVIGNTSLHRITSYNTDTDVLETATALTQQQISKLLCIPV